MTREEFTKYLKSDLKPAKKQMTKAELNTAIKTAKPEVMGGPRHPGYTRNPVTGMLEKTVTKEFTVDNEESRTQRLSKFDPSSQAHILKSTKSFSADKFEATVKRLEYSLLGIL